MSALPAVVVACVFGMLAVAVPNFHAAVERGHQKRTMSDMRSIGTAVESYAVDHDAYPSAASLEELRPMVHPAYIREWPERDGWGKRFRFQSAAIEAGAMVPGPATGYVLRSAGSDGAWEHEDPCDYEPSQNTRFEQDIVFGGCMRE